MITGLQNNCHGGHFEKQSIFIFYSPTSSYIILAYLLGASRYYRGSKM